MESESNKSVGWKPTLVGSLLAFLASATIVVCYLLFLYPLMPLPKDLPPMPFVPTAEVMQIHQQAHLEFSRNNGCITLAILGLSLGVGLGVFTSQRTARIKASLLAGVAGALVGAILGAVLGQRNSVETAIPLEPSILRAIIYHGIVWTVISTSVFLAISLAHKRVDVAWCLARGIAGGLVAATVYCIQSQQFFEFSNVTLIVPESSTEKVVWALVGLICVAACTLERSGSNAVLVEPSAKQTSFED